MEAVTNNIITNLDIYRRLSFRIVEGELLLHGQSSSVFFCVILILKNSSVEVFETLAIPNCASSAQLK